MSADGEEFSTFLSLTTRQQLLLILAPSAAVAAQLSRFFNSPVEFIVNIVVRTIPRYIADSILSLGAYIVSSILGFGEFLAASLGIAQSQLLAPFVYVGNSVAGAIAFVQVQLTSVVVQAGPLGPPLMIGLAAVTAWGVYLLVTRLGIGLIGEFPGGSTVLSLLGLD